MLYLKDNSNVFRNYNSFKLLKFKSKDKKINLNKAYNSDNIINNFLYKNL